MKKCRPNYRTNNFPGCGKVKPIFKYGGCQQCIIKWATTTDDGKEWHKKQTAYKYKKNLNEKKKEERRERKRLRDEMNTGDAMRSADIYFSRFIRLKYSTNFQGERLCACATCSIMKPIKEMDNGHYMKREHKSTRYHENNCRPQCKTCNGDTKHNGKQIEFREALVNELGEEEVVKIEQLSRQTIKADGKFYREVAKKYREEVNKIQKQIKAKYW